MSPRRIWCLLLAVAAVLVLPLAQADAAPVLPWPDQPVGTLTNPATGLAMDVFGYRTDAQTPIQVWPLLGADNQRWKLVNVPGGVEIRGIGSGMCVDVQWGSTENWAPVWQWPCYGGTAQVWSEEIFRTRPDGVRTTKFRNINSGKCLTMDGLSGAQGRQLRQFDCSGTDLRQEWALTTSPQVAACTTPAVPPGSKFRALGNRNTFWHSTQDDPFWHSNGGFLPGDLVRFTASGSTQIATWGSHKPASGDVGDIAPDDGRWPLPGSPKYGLLMRVRTGSAVWVSGRGFARPINPGQWQYIGQDSGCLMVKQAPGDFEFLINDANIGDNNDGPDVVAAQWRGTPYYTG
jgi:hypothetical protein